LQISQIKLLYKLDAIQPAIDNKTMTFHYGTHYAAYVNNTNAALANATNLSGKSNLTGQYNCSASYSKLIQHNMCIQHVDDSFHRYRCPGILAHSCRSLPSTVDYCHEITHPSDLMCCLWPVRPYHQGFKPARDPQHDHPKPG
jgi:hypothetical protein